MARSKRICRHFIDLNSTSVWLILKFVSKLCMCGFGSCSRTITLVNLAFLQAVAKWFTLSQTNGFHTKNALLKKRRKEKKFKTQLYFCCISYILLLFGFNVVTKFIQH